MCILASCTDSVPRRYHGACASRHHGEMAADLCGPSTGPGCLVRSGRQLPEQVPHRVRGTIEGRPFVIGQRDLDDLLHPAVAQDDRYANVEAVDSVLAAEVRGARQDAPPIPEDRLDHLDDRRGRRVVGAPGLEKRHHLSAAVAGPLDELLDPLRAHQLRDGDAADGRVARQRHHRVAVTAKDEATDVADADLELRGDEGAEPGRVQDAGHADDAFGREAGRLERYVAHRVEWVRHDDDDRARADGGSLLHDGPHDARVLGHEVVAAHARLARQAGGHDDDLRARGVRVIVRAGDPDVVADDRGGLDQVERLALGQPLNDINQHDVGEARLDDLLGGGRTDVAGADDGDLAAENAGHWVLLRAAIRVTRWRWPGSACWRGL